MSVGSLIQPSMGIALSESSVREILETKTKWNAELTTHTLMKYVTHWTIIQNHNFAQIRFNARQVLDVRPIPKRTVLAIVPTNEKFPLLFQPVNHRICVLLNASRKHDELVPLADFAEEVIAMWALVYIIQDRMLRSQCSTSAEANGTIELDFDHVARGHATTLGKGVD